MKISKEGEDFIKGYEKCKLKAYQCSSGVWTYGWGHTDGVKKGDTITQAQADSLFIEDIQWVEHAINSGVKVPLTQNQYDALCSLVFNIGDGAFNKSTLLKVLNKGQYDAVPAQIARWNKSKGKVSNGLVIRRQAEATVWMRSHATSNAMPQDVTPPDKPLVKSRTMANASVAGAVGTAIAVAPAIEPAGQVVELAQNNTQGFLLVIGLALVAFAAVAIYLRWDDRRKSA